VALQAWVSRAKGFKEVRQVVYHMCMVRRACIYGSYDIGQAIESDLDSQLLCESQRPQVQTMDSTAV
jgi:hypothetical protein